MERTWKWANRQEQIEKEIKDITTYITLEDQIELEMIKYKKKLGK